MANFGDVIIPLRFKVERKDNPSDFLIDDLLRPATIDSAIYTIDIEILDLRKHDSRTIRFQINQATRVPEEQLATWFLSTGSPSDIVGGREVDYLRRLQTKLDEILGGHLSSDHSEIYKQRGRFWQALVDIASGDWQGDDTRAVMPNIIAREALGEDI